MRPRVDLCRGGKIAVPPDGAHAWTVVVGLFRLKLDDALPSSCTQLSGVSGARDPEVLDAGQGELRVSAPRHGLEHRARLGDWQGFEGGHAARGDLIEKRPGDGIEGHRGRSKAGGLRVNAAQQAWIHALPRRRGRVRQVGPPSARREISSPR